MKKSPVKVKRVADRRYRETYSSESGRLTGIDLLAPAEYGVFVNGEQIARIVKTWDGWRVVKPTASSKFGVAVSPVGLNKFSSVKKFALEHFTPPYRFRRNRARGSALRPSHTPQRSQRERRVDRKAYRDKHLWRVTQTVKRPAQFMS